jgi:hypothetical protein
VADDPYASVARDDPYAAVAQPAAAATTSVDPVQLATKLAGGGLRNTLHVGQGLLEALSAPQRGVAGIRKYVDDNHLENGAILAHPDKFGAALAQGGSFFMDPKKQDEAGKIDRAALGTDQGGFIPSDAQINAHLSGPAASIARWGAQTAAETIADPVTGLPVGAIGKLAKGLGGARALEAAGKLPGAAKLADVRSQLFNPEHHLQGLTEHGQNVVAATQNRFKQGAAIAKRGEDAAIAAGRKDIKAGTIPQSVQDAFAKYGATVPQTKTPSEMRRLLDEARSAYASKQTSHALKTVGLLGGDTGAAAGLKIKPKAGLTPQDLFKDPANADAARAGVAEHIAPEAKAADLFSKAVAASNSRLKSMFLAVPFPHVGNLTNLSYNRYGVGPTLRGLGYAAQESLGKRSATLDDLIGKLRDAGADNQYDKLFGETNPIMPIRQIQRFANAAQDKVLNPVERGLRASMLQEELRQGKTGVDAARNIHKALGTDADTGFTKALNRVPLSQFPRFHTQTAIGSYGRTLAHAPHRVTTFQHAFGAPDQTPNGQAHFHLSTPTAAGLKMTSNPLGYFASPSTLGGMLNITGDYSPLGLAAQGLRYDKQGHARAAGKAYQKAVSAAVTPLLPASGSLQALYEMAKNKRGRARETAQQDLLSSFIGGYWSKQ